VKSLELSPLEAALIKIFHGLYSARGFPPPDGIRVRKRENTGAGRYVDLDVVTHSQLEDGYLDLGGKFIEMEGVPHGLMAVIHVKDHRPDQLEIAVYGNDPWDGEEREWSVL